MQNYRIPDVVCFAKDTSAVDCDTHWHGGPEFAIEITKNGEKVTDEKATDKLDFDAGVGTREVLVVERGLWQISLFGVDESAKKMKLVAVSTADNPRWVASEIIPVKVQLDWPQKTIHDDPY